MAWISLIVLYFLASSYNAVARDSKEIGVVYGDMINNLPSPIGVVKTFKQYGIRKMRIFEPNPPLLDALRGSGIDLVFGIKNQDIPSFAASQDAVEKWFAANILPYFNDISITIIAVGNEIVPGQFSDSIVAAMQNIQHVIQDHNLQGIRVTTVVNMGVLSKTFPPSTATFSDASKPFMTAIIKQLQNTGAPLLLNLYPYYYHASSPEYFPLDYVQFTATKPVVQDRNLEYMNLFDAMVDCFFWAMEKIKVTNVDLAISESGWPHAGNGQFTTVDLAKTYNQNFMHHMLNHTGTPKKPFKVIEWFIFSMFDEDKPSEIGRNFGMFKPNFEPNYNIFS